MFERLKRFAHDILGWGFPYHRDYDGYQWSAKCKFCDGRLLQDSNGDYFHKDDYVLQKKH